MKKYISELFGTFVLVFIGCGTVVFSAPYIGNLGIALAFGLAVMAMVYAVGPISGAHLNPAVTLGVLTAGRINLKQAVGYIIFQFLGAILASFTIVSVLTGRLVGYDIDVQGLGQNGWGENYAGGYNADAAMLFEFIATFIFVKVILKTTETDLKIAGVVIGLTLTMLHIVGLPITGVSVNPARSFGPALLVQGQAWAQVWLFLLIPSVAGIVAGLTSRFCCCCCCGNGSCELKKAEAKPEQPAKISAKEKVATKKPLHHNNNRRNTNRKPARKD
ncbi:MAG: aquaporin [Alphaproteobacteria bacterium]